MPRELKQLVAESGRRTPVIAVVAGSGQVARYAAEAGADFLLALNAGLYRRLATFYPHDAGTPHPPRHCPGPSR